MNDYALLVGASFIAGVLNAAAGGGSFFSFPALLAVGVPPVNANATNTVALWPGQIASILAFRSQLSTVRPMVVPVAIASAIGGVAGAVALLNTRQGTFLKIVPWLLLFATLLFAVSEPAMRQLRRMRSGGGAELPVAALRISPALFIGLTMVCFYIGYFGAGSGFLIITLFSFTGLKGLTPINTLKVICTSVSNGIAVITFIVAGAVYWSKVPYMLLAALAGGYLGAAYSQRMNPALLKGLIIASGLALSLYYFRASL
jgi:uncharacterized membrane protein YfcA